MFNDDAVVDCNVAMVFALAVLLRSERSRLFVDCGFCCRQAVTFHSMGLT